MHAAGKRNIFTGLQKLHCRYGTYKYIVETRCENIEFYNTCMEYLYTVCCMLGCHACVKSQNRNGRRQHSFTKPAQHTNVALLHYHMLILEMKAVN